MKAQHCFRWLLAASSLGVVADVFDLGALADVTLFQFAPANNAGRSPTLFVGGIDESQPACRTVLTYQHATQCVPAGAGFTILMADAEVFRAGEGAGVPLEVRVPGLSGAAGFNRSRSPAFERGEVFFRVRRAVPQLPPGLN